MKKILPGLTMVVLLFSACRKDLQDRDQSEADLPASLVKIENGYLNFRTAAAYDQFLKRPGKEDFIRALPGAGAFTSFKQQRTKMKNQPMQPGVFQHDQQRWRGSDRR